MSALSLIVEALEASPGEFTSYSKEPPEGLKDEKIDPEADEDNPWHKASGEFGKNPGGKSVYSLFFKKPGSKRGYGEPEKRDAKGKLIVFNFGDKCGRSDPSKKCLDKSKRYGAGSKRVGKGSER